MKSLRIVYIIFTLICAGISLSAQTTAAYDSLTARYRLRLNGRDLREIVTTISGASTHFQSPTAKAVWNLCQSLLPTLTAGTGISVTGTTPNFTVTNTAPDQTVALTGAGINVITGTYPNFTITGTEVDGSVTNEGSLTVGAGSGTTSIINSNTSGSTGVTLTASTGLSISEASNVITLTNSSPDQTVSITGAGINAVTGTYPNFTITGTEVDGSITNEGSLTVGAGSGTTSIINSNTSGSTGVTLTASTGLSISEASNVITLTNSSPDQTVSITGAGINAVTGTYPNFTITGTEVDGSITNEGSLTVGAGSGTTSIINSNTSGSTGVTLTASTGLSIAESSNVITLTNSSPDQTVALTGAGINVITGTYPNFTITGTEVDGSTTNEIQTFGNSGTTSYTNTLSGGGGSFTLSAGSGVTISHSAGTVTISASGGAGTVTNFSAGDLSPLFTTSEATTTTTPALTFALSNAAANTWYGNNTAGSTTPAFNASGALTKTDDTNVTVTLGGAPTTALLNAASMTLGWTGTLAVSRGGLGVGTITGLMQGNGTSAVTGITNSSTTGQTLRVTGVSTYAWGALDLANTSAVTGDLASSNIAQGSPHSVWGVTGNSTADHADIQSAAADAVLVANGSNTGVSFSTVNTNGITNLAVSTGKIADDAVTYAKLQNVSANTVVLGNILGTNQNAQELTVANLYTMLGMSGAAGRTAYWSGTNTLTNSANWLWDNTNGRVTIIPQVAGLGGGFAALNINPPGAGTMGSMEAIRAWGNIAGNILSGLYNTNTATSSNAIYTISTPDAAGDPILQFNITGDLGGYTSMGLDNSDANKFKLTPNGTYPGNYVDAGLVMTQDVIPLTGINNDSPLYPLDVKGFTSSTAFLNRTNVWSSGNFTAGAGLGTGGSITSATGGANWLKITFQSGTSPTANGNVFTGTYPTAYPTSSSYVVICACNANAANEITKFYMSGATGGGFNVQANGTLTASTTYSLCAFTGGIGN
jgi:hypothetical protein